MYSDEEKLRPDTLAAQALGWRDPTTKAITLPIHPSSTFIRDSDNQYRAGYSYGRDQNPTFDQAETLLTRLEKGWQSRLFSSGMAAVAAIFLALPQNSRVIVPDVMYWGVTKWLKSIGKNLGLDVCVIPAGELAALEQALRQAPCALVWIETPANPTWQITDIAAAADLAHAHGAKLAVDSTAATPVLTQPLTMGADFVMHSVTKYLNGHSDLIGGAVISAEDGPLWRAIADQRNQSGAIMGAFEAWLLTRGMRTLFLRVERACTSAMTIARHFEQHPKLAAVLYPGLESFPGHEIANRQMQGGYSGMLSIRLKGGQESAIATAANVRLWKRATSFGGVESLIEHRASVEGKDTNVPVDLLRLSVGAENPNDLIEDLKTALAQGQG